MSFIRDRLEGFGRSFRVGFFGVIGLAFSVLALGCVSMAIWGLIQIFFITMWLTIKAALWALGCGVAALIASAMFALTKPKAKPSKPGTVEVLTPEQYRERKGEKSPLEIRVWEKGTDF